MGRNNLWKYMNTHHGVPVERAEEVWRPLFRKYNQSLRGLRAGGFDIEAEEYWDCLRAGAEKYLFPNAEVPYLLNGQIKHVKTPNTMASHCLLC
jgi:hypothetical protein